MSPTESHERLAAQTATVADRPLDTALATWLNAEHGPASASYFGLKQACVISVAEGCTTRTRTARST